MGCGGSKGKQPEKSKQLSIATDGKPSNGKRVRTKPTDVKISNTAEGKIVLLGESGVGKSSIAMRFVESRFSDGHDVTIGGAYFQKNVILPKSEPTGQDKTVTMHLWDTGGHEKFRSMMNLYYRDAIGAIVCYDMTDEKSF